MHVTDDTRSIHKDEQVFEDQATVSVRCSWSPRTVGEIVCVMLTKQCAGSHDPQGQF